MKKKSIYSCFIGGFIKNGKRTKAKRIVDTAFRSLALNLKCSMPILLRLVASKLTCSLEMKTAKIRRNELNIPSGIRQKRQDYLIVKKVLDALNEDTSKRSQTEKLFDEISGIVADRGSRSLTKQSRLLKEMAQNRSNIHFRW